MYHISTSHKDIVKDDRTRGNLERTSIMSSITKNMAVELTKVRLSRKIEGKITSSLTDSKAIENILKEPSQNISNVHGKSLSISWRGRRRGRYAVNGQTTTDPEAPPTNNFFDVQLRALI